METGEPQVETMPDLNLGVFTMTPEQSQDTELVEEETQQQENVEADQNFFTQEPTSSGIIVYTPIQFGTVDPQVDIILDVELGEDEQMQSQLLGDTELFGDQSHLSWNVEVTHERPQHPEKMEGMEGATQEPAPMELPIEAIVETQEDVEIETQEDVFTQETTSSQMAAEVDRNGFQEQDDVTQEPTSPELIAEVPIQEEVVGSLVEEEVVSLLIQNDQAETSGDKVQTQFSQNFVNLEFDEEKDAGDGTI